MKLTKIQRVWHFFSYNRVALLFHWGKILPYITLIYNNVLAINTLFKQANINSNLLVAKSIDKLRFYRRRILSNRLNLEIGIKKMSKRQINSRINQIYDDALFFQLIADDLRIEDMEIDKTQLRFSIADTLERLRTETRNYPHRLQ